MSTHNFDGSTPQTIAEELRIAERVANSPYGEDGPHHRLLPDTDLPVGDTAVYRSIAITSLPLTDRTWEISGALDVLGGPPAGSATSPAEGVILTHEQGWRMRGVTLGRLLHSMTLAPGEVTQVAVSSWERRTSGETSEDVAEREQASQDAGRQRDIHSVTDAVASESQFGMSSAASASAQMDVGASFLIASGGSSSNIASASTARFSLGSRSAKADSKEQIRQATQQHAANARRRRASVVSEVATSETENFQTRVVANYNHQHALNLMYYEVLQVFELSTRVIEAERCVFLPMEVRTFDIDTIRTFAAPLARVARSIGDDRMARRIGSLGRPTPALQAERRSAQADQESAARALEREKSVFATAIKVVKTKARELDEQTRQLEDASTAWSAATNRLNTEPILFQVDGGPFQKFPITVTLPEAEEFFRSTGLTMTEPQRLAELRAEEAQAKTRYDVLQSGHVRIRGELDMARAEETVAQRAVNTAAADKRRADEHLADIGLAMAHSDDDIVQKLNERKLAYNQALWMQMSPDQVRALVSGKRVDGEPLLTTIDPRPVTVEGNMVGFRWTFSPERSDAAEEFRRRHVDEAEEPPEDRQVVVLPTGGVFTEAVAGQANAAETIDLTRHWKWDETTIPILPTAIAKLKQQHHEQVADLRAKGLGVPATQLQGLPNAPPPPAHSLAAAISTSLFRDMSGQDVIQSLAEAAQETTKKGSEAAMEEAHKNIAAYMDHLEQMAPQAMEFLKKNASKLQSGEGGTGGLNPTEIGGLQNALGGEGAGLDIGALLSEAAEIGLML